MATRNNHPVDHVAQSDLRTKEYAFGKIIAGGVTACSVLGERADCILNNAPNTGEVAQMQHDGICKVKVGAVAVADAAELTPDANGLAITAVATNIVRAKALEAGGAGAIIRAEWVAAYAKP